MTDVDVQLVARALAAGNKWRLTQQLRNGMFARAVGATPGGSQATVGPFTVNFDDAGLVNPETGNGIQTVALPANAIVEAFAVLTSPWEGPQTESDELDVVVAASVDGPNLHVVDYGAQFGIPEGPGFQEFPPPLRARRIVTTEDCFVFVSLFANTPPTGGSWDVYALVTPLS